MDQIRILAVAVLAVLAAPAVSAFPVPSSGKFAYPGAPAFLSGAFIDVSSEIAAISLLQENQRMIWILTPENASYVLAPDPVTPFLGVYNIIESFQCVDANTAVYMAKGVRPLDNLTTSTCVLAYSNATHLVIRSIPDTGGDDLPTTCPDNIFGDVPGSITFYYTRVKGVVSPQKSVVCKNETVTPSALLGAESKLPVIDAPPVPSRTPYPELGGPPIVNGIWDMDGALAIASPAGYAILDAAEKSLVPAQQTVSMRTGAYYDYDCLNPLTYRAFSSRIEYFINGTLSYSYACEVGRRETLENRTTVLYLATRAKGGSSATDCPVDLWFSPDAQKQVFTLLEDFPWKPAVECNPSGVSPNVMSSPTPPSPESSPTPPSSGAVGIGLAVFPMILLVLLL